MDTFLISNNPSHKEGNNGSNDVFKILQKIKGKEDFYEVLDSNEFQPRRNYHRFHTTQSIFSSPDIEGVTPMGEKYYKHMRKHYASFIRTNHDKVIELNSNSNSFKNNNKDSHTIKLTKQLDDSLNSIYKIDTVLERLEDRRNHLTKQKSDSRLDYEKNYLNFIGDN